MIMSSFLAFSAFPYVLSPYVTVIAFCNASSTVYRGKKEGILQNQKEDLIQGLLDGSLNLAVKFKNINEK